MLEDYLGLHEDITLYYIPDGTFKAALYTQDGGVEVADGTGETVEEALKDLHEELRKDFLDCHDMRKRV